MNPPDRRGFHPIPARPPVRIAFGQGRIRDQELIVSNIVPIPTGVVRPAGQNPGSVQVLLINGNYKNSGCYVGNR